MFFCLSLKLQSSSCAAQLCPTVSQCQRATERINKRGVVQHGGGAVECDFILQLLQIKTCFLNSLPLYFNAILKLLCEVFHIRLQREWACCTHRWSAQVVLLHSGTDVCIFCRHRRHVRCSNAPGCQCNKTFMILWGLAHSMSPSPIFSTLWLWLLFSRLN